MRHAREHKGKSDGHFEMNEQDNERHAMSSERSHQTPESMANYYGCVHEMKGEAMDEAYGAAGRDTSDASKIKSQMMHYNWS